MAHTRWVNWANLEKRLPPREAGDYMLGALQSVRALVSIALIRAREKVRD